MNDSSVQKATCPSQQSLYAVFRGSRHLFPFLGTNTSRQLIFPPTLPFPGLLSVLEIAPFQRRKQLVSISSSLPTPPLAIDLFELVAFIAVAIALGIAIVITSRGSAALFRRFLCSGVPGTPQRQKLTEALALLAQVVASAAQVVST